jgi:serine/threonine protein phosphatase 1
MPSNARSWLGAGSRWLAGDRSRRDDPAPAVRHLPAGQRVYAIGDVHGRLDLLEQLIDRIERDCRTRSAAATTIVLLGDLVDRGPRSSHVVELAAGWSASWAKLKVLRGNHEALLLMLLEGRTARLNS